jgi:hypothetical protein
MKTMADFVVNFESSGPYKRPVVSLRGDVLVILRRACEQKDPLLVTGHRVADPSQAQDDMHVLWALELTQRGTSSEDFGSVRARVGADPSRTFAMHKQRQVVEANRSA